MPLSEEELRLLEQMERALVEEDPKFASTLRGTSFKRAARRRAILAGVVFVLGIAVLMSGAIFRLIPVGVIGFVVMLISATYGLTALRGRATPAKEGEVKETRHHGFGVVDGGRTHRPKARRERSSAPFMERMEERWRRRRDDNGGF
ncbi:DUF3040 domain-containing protein [Nocardioides jensenii]|uniref:DUF3040 domain-containing protein n=1 Tax=Nocardioides jensenii TaxID=1843 RepID=UPI000832DB9B|nr:DUF3040 domain-containing protein [Nocardioides jensenii]